jgi:hypothetical protein
MNRTPSSVVLFCLALSACAPAAIDDRLGTAGQDALAGNALAKVESTAQALAVTLQNGWTSAPYGTRNAGV